MPTFVLVLVYGLLVVIWFMLGMASLRMSGRGFFIANIAQNDECQWRFWIYLLIALIFWPIQYYALLCVAKLDDWFHRT
jgi:hypothetical protein